MRDPQDWGPKSEGQERLGILGLAIWVGNSAEVEGLSKASMGLPWRQPIPRDQGALSARGAVTQHRILSAAQAPGRQSFAPFERRKASERQGMALGGSGKSQKGPRRQQWARGRIMGEGDPEAVVSGAEVDLPISSGDLEGRAVTR